MSSKRYGTDHYWCFIEDKWDGKEVAIWKSVIEVWKTGEKETEQIIARAIDKYEAKTIVDALLNYVHIEDKTKLGKKELAFLEFVNANCVEPYATMASNAILWNDRETYNKLKSEFPVIYS